MCIYGFSLILLAYYYKKRSMNLSFHKPKKDQCGLCKCYTEGSEEVKAYLEKEYFSHILEKETINKFCENTDTNDVDSDLEDPEQLLNEWLGELDNLTGVSVFNIF
ncbi:unnamed protein product [Acanthoscelides obtectus]|uniref:Uncharacterized protein n=1 Tax=Acanthoscelides obtectus TaxID=200917 RepID=A0A9P0MFM0_ACAOB|nr:unnamed protein product [Acanthoscelides obtectus]CAK1633858.1 hypothetical protein AOBTE_LOCUS8441 [Acanthoscelides obtectus]